MNVIEQLDGIDPSVPDALFRRLLYDESLGYLREGNTITGFELDIEQTVLLEGYALVAIQKHAILAFRSDLDEPYKLILFPTMDTLDDPNFGLQKLTVIRKVFTRNDFMGETVKTGLLKDVAADLIPPFKAVEVDDDMAKAMRSSVREETLRKPKKRPKRVSIQPQEPSPPVDTPFDETPVDHPDFDDAPVEQPDFDDAPVEHPDFDDAPVDQPDFDDVPFGAEPDFDEPEPEPEPEPMEDARALQLKAQPFEKLHEVKDYATVHLNVRSEIASTVLDVALNKGQALGRDGQIQMAVAILAKAINQGKA